MNGRKSLLLLVTCGAIGLAAQAVFAQGLLRRLGGPTDMSATPLSVWSDEVIFNGYRIQQHSVIGHYKLIDPEGQRITFGEYQNCADKLYEMRSKDQIPELPKHVVIVLHGLGAGRGYMQPLADFLEREGNLATVNFGYPSTKRKVEKHAESLASVIRNLDGVETIDFVAHSMGNIVVRKYLYDFSRLDPAERPPIKFNRMVMISPPNHGARAADNWADNRLGKMLAGKPMEQLAPNRGWPELEEKLAIPDFEFGIIAGGKGNDDGYLPTIPGDDDFLLSIETMRLSGANDFIQTGGIHQLMAKYTQVREFTLAYLQNGFFVSAEARQPIE